MDALMSTVLLSPIIPAPAYHWTGANQRCFLETLAQTGVVSLAAKAVAMSAQAAYDFRMRAGGRVFALGWLAAILLARDRLVDDLLERAFMGQEEEMIRDPDNNRLVRKRIDNRLGMGMLARLDRMAEAAPRAIAGSAAGSAAGALAGRGDAFTQSARLVAGDFERYLDLVEREGGGSEAGLFLATQAATGADQHLCAFHYQLPQNSGDVGEEDDEDNADLDAATEIMPAFDDSPDGIAAHLTVWRDDDADEWRTDFPPPQDFEGAERRCYGDDSYERALTEAEAAVQDARQYVEDKPYIEAAHKACAAFFVPDATVKAEMRRRAAEEKAELKTAAKAQAALARRAEKRRLSQAKLANEQAAREMEECPALRGDDLEINAADTLDWTAPDDNAVVEAPQTSPGYRTITMPQKPRPLFGIYGDNPPGRSSVW
jgi:hypothetical protein